MRSYAFMRSKTMFSPRLVLCDHGLRLMSLGYMLCGRFFQIVIASVVSWNDLWNGLCCDAIPCEWGWSTIMGQRPTRVHFPLKSSLKHTWTLSPVPNLCPCSVASILPPPPCKRTRELDPWSTQHFKDENFLGDCKSFKWPKLLGDHEQAF